MNNMKNLIIILLTIFLISCEDTKVGYLNTKDAGYLPNVMTVRLTMDPELDEERIEDPYPWISARISGVRGTAPIFFELVGATSENGNVDEFLKYTNLRGDSSFEVQENVTIPVGEYHMNIRVYNKDYSDILNDVFTIIVE